MDPNATLKMIDDFLAARRSGPEVDEWVENLRDWIDGGGFEPDWDAFPLGASYYRTRMVGR